MTVMTVKGDVEEAKPSLQGLTLNVPEKPYSIKNEWPHFPKLQTLTGEKHIHHVVLENLRAASTVALISIPLSASLSIASNSTPMMGIATSFWSGLIMSIFGTSDFNIQGCSGALSPMVAQYIFEWGRRIDPVSGIKDGSDVMPYIAFLAGIFLFLFRVLRLDKYLFHMPSAVFEGFSFAVGIIIGFNQLNFAFDLHPHHKHAHFYMNVIESFKILDQAKVGSTVYFLVNTTILLILMRKVPKIPWIPVSAMIGCLIGWGFDPVYGPSPNVMNLPTLRTAYMRPPSAALPGGSEGFLEAQLVYPIEPIGNVFGGDTPLIPADKRIAFVFAALRIAFVCALETVLSAKIASKRNGDYPFVESKELAAASLSQFIQGITGTLPNTGLFLRTNANVQAKATHRMSHFVNIIILGVITLLLSWHFSFLPQASAAAILASGSIRMVPVTYLRNLWKIDKSRLLLCLGVTALSVIQDPVVGLLVGMFVAFFANAKLLVEGKETCDIRPLGTINNGAFKVTLNGPLSYINGEQMEKYTKLLHGSAKVVIMGMECVSEADSDGITFLERAVKGLQGQGCAVVFSNVRKGVAKQLRVFDTLAKLEQAVLTPETQEILQTLDLSAEAGGYWAQTLPAAKNGGKMVNGAVANVAKNAISL